MFQLVPAIDIEDSKDDQRRRRRLPVDLHQAEVQIDEGTRNPILVSYLGILLVDVGQSAGSEVVERIRTLVSPRQLREVDIAGQKHHALGPRFLDEIEEPLPLVGVVAPLVHPLLVGDDLGARGDEADVGRLAELLFEPGPLGRP